MICSVDGEKFQCANCTEFQVCGASACDLHDVHFFLILFAAVLKKRHLDSTRLTQGPTWHHQTRGSTYFQCNVSIYAHVWGLKLHKILQVRAPI
jgi:hypothetical protein